MNPDQIIGIILDAISKRSPLFVENFFLSHLNNRTTEQMTDDFRFGLNQLFDILDLKEEYKSKLHLDWISADQLPSEIPLIKVPDGVLMPNYL